MSSNFNEVHPANIELNWVTLEISKLDNSKYCKLEQSRNIEPISSTEDVLKLAKSSDVKELHPWNIELIVVAEDVLKLVKSIDLNELIPENIESKFWTNDTSKCDKSIDIIFSEFGSLLKKFCKFVIADEKYITILLPPLIDNFSVPVIFKLWSLLIINFIVSLIPWAKPNPSEYSAFFP